MQRVTTTYDHFDHFQDYASTAKPIFQQKRKLIKLNSESKLTSPPSSRKFIVNYIQCKQCMRLLGEQQWPIQQNSSMLISSLRLKNVNLDASESILFYKQKNRKTKNLPSPIVFPQQQKIIIQCGKCKLKVGYIYKNVPFFEKLQIVCSKVRYGLRTESKSQEVKFENSKNSVEVIYQQLFKYIQSFYNQHKIDSSKVAKLEKNMSELQNFITFYMYYRGKKHQRKEGHFVDQVIK